MPKTIKSSKTVSLDSSFCRVCQGKAKKVQEIKSTSIYLCKDCGSYFAWPVPTPTELSKMYEESTMNEDAGAEPLNEKGDVIVPFFKKKDIDLYKAILNKYRKKHKRIMDIGALWGIFLYGLDNSYDKHAIEIWPPGIKLLKKHKVKVKVGTLETAKLDQKYDIITMFDVLEHVPDVDKALDKITAALPKGGLFMVSVPNAHGLWPRILHGSRRHVKKETWDPLPFPFHLYYYSPKGITAAFKRHGLQVKEVNTASTHLHMINMERVSPWKKAVISFFEVVGLSIGRGDRLIVIAEKVK